MILSLKVYQEKRKELVGKINDCSNQANEALMTNNWMEYSQLNKVILKLRQDLAILDDRSTAHE